MYTKKDIGNRGETVVAAFLTQHGFTLVGRNMHCRYGEVDIAVFKEGALHIVEVKTRRSMATDVLGESYAAEAFTWAKWKKMLKTVAELDKQRRLPTRRSTHIALAAVTLVQRQAPHIQLFWDLGPGDW